MRSLPIILALATAPIEFNPSNLPINMRTLQTHDDEGYCFTVSMADKRIEKPVLLSQCVAL